MRSTGQVKEIAKLQLFAWDAGERGSNVHLQVGLEETERVEALQQADSLLECERVGTPPVECLLFHLK